MLTQHCEIAAAIRRKDPDAAENTMYEHPNLTVDDVVVLQQK
ncbi:FCD domain-containing protein [Paenibacillus humicola]